MTKQTAKAKTEFETLPNFYDRWRESVNLVEKKLWSEKKMLWEHFNNIRVASIHPSNKNKQENVLRSYQALQKYIHKETGIILPGDLEEYNIYLILSRVQRKTGIDLGVCDFLDTKLRGNMRRICLREYDHDLTPQCSLNDRLYFSGADQCLVKMYVSGLENCMFERRDNCSYRQKHLANKKVLLANYGGVMIGVGK